jgi:hypothetical protein
MGPAVPGINCAFCPEEDLVVNGEKSVNISGISGHLEPKNDTKISFISL